MTALLPLPSSQTRREAELVTLNRLKHCLACLLEIKDAHPETEGIDAWIRRFATEVKARRQAQDDIEEARRLIQ